MVSRGDNRTPYDGENPGKAIAGKTLVRLLGVWAD